MGNIEQPTDPNKEQPTPPVVIGDNSTDKINEIIQTQMAALLDNFKNQFGKEYDEKLRTLKTQESEVEEKKQRIAVAEELKSEGLDGGLIDFVYDKDIEISKGKIKQLKNAIQTEVDKGILERLKQSYVPPRDNPQQLCNSNSYKPKYFV